MVIPISERQDTIGPMARTVKDAAIILQAIAGPDKNDNYTLASPFGSHLPNYVAACTLSGLKGKRIGIPRNVINTLDASSEPIVSAFEAAVSVISKAGATIVEEMRTSQATTSTSTLRSHRLLWLLTSSAILPHISRN